MTDEWMSDERMMFTEALPRLRDIIENESAVILEHRHYKAGRSPTRLVFDDFEVLEAYVRTQTSAGDALYAWKYEVCCTTDNATVVGRMPDASGKVPVGGAY